MPLKISVEWGTLLGLDLSSNSMLLFYVQKTFGSREVFEISAVVLSSNKHTTVFLGFQSATDKNDMKLKRRANESEDLCFFVRCKINIYCADDGIWSEWSEEECWEGMH